MIDAKISPANLTLAAILCTSPTANGFTLSSNESGQIFGKFENGIFRFSSEFDYLLPTRGFRPYSDANLSDHINMYEKVLQKLDA